VIRDAAAIDRARLVEDLGGEVQDSVVAQCGT
jgi:hypothetical protein